MSMTTAADSGAPSDRNTHQMCPLSHQVGGDEGSNEEAHIDVDGVATMLCDLSQASQRCSNGKCKHQHGFEQLGAV